MKDKEKIVCQPQLAGSAGGKFGQTFSFVLICIDYFQCLDVSLSLKQLTCMNVTM